MSPSLSLRAFAGLLTQSFPRRRPFAGVAGLQRIHRLVQPARHGLLTAAVMLSLAGRAKAAGSSMPWEGPLQSILDSIQGPVARIVAVIIIIATGLALAFGDTSGGFRKLIQIVFGLSIAFAASSFFLSFFSFSGGALV
jgi:type IV secretion system protein VirB2|nr:TrbC/VirB2 family protein [Acidovorax sp.]